MWTSERHLLASTSRYGRRILFLPHNWRILRCGLRQSLLFFVVFSVLTLFCLSQYLLRQDHVPELSRSIPTASFQCHRGPGASFNPVSLSHERQVSNASSQVDSKVLLFVETQYSILGRQIVEVLEASRIKFKIEISGKSLPVLTNLEKGKFAVIVFENYDRYIHMNNWNRELLDKYCSEFAVGIIGFMPRPKSLDVESKTRVNGFPLYLKGEHGIQKYVVNPLSPVLRITKAGEIPHTLPDHVRWTSFHFNDSAYSSVGHDLRSHSFIKDHNTGPSPDIELGSLVPHAAIVQDDGTLDGIQRILFGTAFELWIQKLIFMDAISFLSHERLSLSLRRFLLIDIDDIFVGESGTRMKAADVHALLAAQQTFASLIPGFKFNLGFSGKYYHKGTPEEDEGDDLLIRHADQFWWFCHMFSHSQPHLFNNTILESEMRLNKDFALKHKLPASSGYSIAPHHSGVYPVHEPLYDLWKSVWNVRVTSTEEYPHLRPARLRRGFIHRGVMVLPRQTCGLYTHTIFYDKYPGGPRKLLSSIYGGELFFTLVYNPINIFMTHLSNYGNDRLALFTFQSAVRFLQCWTNLQLVTVPPQQLAIHYFQLHPEETDPVWVNPCLDKRHRAIWATNKSCEQLPKFLVVGPQKTGSTALYTFLSMHPSIYSNFLSPDTFEEVQFFNGKNYYKGMDWYMNFFPVPNNGSQYYLFEKSATYFDGDSVPLRVHALLPHVRIVILLISPTQRAYSWYQHMRAHGDEAALNNSFVDVVSADDTAPKSLRDLRNRCLHPGMYAQHLEHWLVYFPPQQILIVDGDELKSDPSAVMDRLQAFLKIEPYFDYRQHLKFDVHKGFYCPVVGRTVKCLGKGKGRRYPSLTDNEEMLVREFYMRHNVALSKLLTKLRQPIPLWLEQDLSRPQ